MKLKLNDDIVVTECGHLFPTIHFVCDNFKYLLKPINREISLRAPNGFSGKIKTILLHPDQEIPVYHVVNGDEEIFVSGDGIKTKEWLKKHYK